jgi:hypothetical protein
VLLVLVVQQSAQIHEFLDVFVFTKELVDLGLRHPKKNRGRKMEKKKKGGKREKKQQYEDTYIVE